MIRILFHFSLLFACALLSTACLNLPPASVDAYEPSTGDQPSDVDQISEAVDAAPLLETASLEPYLWNNRLLLIFANSTLDSAYTNQIRSYASLSRELLNRDMIWFHIFEVGPDAPEAVELSMGGILDLHPSYVDAGQKPVAKLPSEFADRLRSTYNPNNAAFRVVLIGKDGGVKYDTTELYGPDQLFSLIDSMPMRQQEMQQDNP